MNDNPPGPGYVSIPAILYKISVPARVGVGLGLEFREIVER